MNGKKMLVAGAALAGIGAAAVGLRASTHPSHAKGPISPDPGRRRRPLDDALFDLPDDVVHHELPTPDGGVVHAIEKGAGRPIVLLHGVTLRSDVWAPQFHQLTDRYRVIAVDLRGHGRSVPGTAGFGLTRLGADLATLLETLDLHGAVLVGHSMGGMTVMQFCGDFPQVLADRVAGLMLVATRAHQTVPPYLDSAARRLVAGGQHRVEAGHQLPGHELTSTRLARLAFGDHPSPKAVRIVGEMGMAMDPAALLPSVGGLLEHDAREALRRTHTPSLVVVGTRDVLTPVPSGSHLAHLLPRSELVVLRRAGHQLMQERPDELAELLDALVARIEGEPGPVSAGVPNGADPGEPVSHTEQGVSPA